MTRREIIAYAITHAGYTPEGKAIKGGPYESDEDFGEQVTRLGAAQRWAPAERSQMEYTLHRARETRPTARVIRIVRARPSPSEASAVEVLRLRDAAIELLGVVREHRAQIASREYSARYLDDLEQRARAAIDGIASGPDPMPVVRAAMAETDAEEAFSAATHCGRSFEAAALDAAARARVEAVAAYRKAGGK